ncbi:hypothetical protein BG006_000515 [Podila minutissima]|uniref:Uncharacterized protein n=1 Tax=Podila minutissima TaxID=64525 RepID=A0A9P5VHR2_9FUNG|nr:hypothetical protein BG006_000515 [Podila minutissima]
MRDSEPEPVLAIGSGNKGWLPDLERRMERGFLRMETGRDEVEVEVESAEVEADSDLDLGVAVVRVVSSAAVTSLSSM